MSGGFPASSRLWFAGSVLGACIACHSSFPCRETPPHPKGAGDPSQHHVAIFILSWQGAVFMGLECSSP